MRKVIGLDLNGWRDHAARDWSLDGEDNEREDNAVHRSQQSENLHYLDGGTAAVVVTFGASGHVGGPQAILSPIGRGGGWGDVGRIDRRRQIVDLQRSLLAGKVDGPFRSQIQAAVDAMTVSAQDVILTVPDRSSFDDGRQQLLLDSLSGPRRKSVRLLWRPVAIVLSALDAKRLPNVREGLRIFCLSHADDGVEHQSLVLRRLAQYPDVFAPERAGYGEVGAANAGLCTLLAEVERLTLAGNPLLGNAKHEPSRLPVRSLLEGVAAGTVEILRLENGTWIQAQAVDLRAQEFFSDEIELGGFAADAVLLTTPLVGSLREAFIARIRAAAGTTPVIDMPTIAAAHGALVAGRRIEKDIPHYLDRLEQISLIGMKDEEATLFDLMPADATVPANREYVSPPITNLSWPAGVGSVNFYIRKGGEFRKWRTPDKPSPTERQPVEIRLRQMPAQGRAKLFATSSTWPTLRANPIFLDWSNLPVDPRSFKEIAAELKPRPIIPERVTARTHSDIWIGHQTFRTIPEILQGFSIGNPASVDELSGALRKKYRIRVSLPGTSPQVFGNFQAVDFEGNAPVGADAQAVARLGHALDQISDSILTVCATKRGTLQSNRPLILATWAFGRCPKPLQDEMLTALASRLAGGNHPLLAPLQSYRVLLHGLGRSITDAKRLTRLIDLVAPHLAQPNFLAALSSALSRPADAPKVLTESRVKQIAESTASILADLRSKKKFAISLKYALLVVGGLLRVRERDPYALLTSSSPAALALASQLRGILDLLRRYPEAFAKSAEKASIVANLIEMLDGRGGNVGVLVDAESLDDEED